MTVDQICKNYRQQSVVFTENVRRHILWRHPEMDSYIDDVCSVLAAPDLVYSLPRTKTHWYYKLGLYREHEAGAYVLVLVGYNDVGEHWVKTSYPILNPVVTPGHYLIFPTGQIS